MQKFEVLSEARKLRIPPAIKKLLGEYKLFEIILPAVAVFLLSRTVLFSVMAPLGVAFYASSSRGKRDIIPLGAALLGYIFISASVPIYKYAAALAIISITSLIVRRQKGEPGAAVMPIACGAGIFVPGVILWALMVGTYDMLALLISESVIAACMVVFFSLALKSFSPAMRDEADNRGIISILILSSSLLLSLTDVSVAMFSIGRLAAVFAVICLAQSGNMPIATVLGLLYGLAVSMTDRSSVYLCVVLGICAVVCGAFLYGGRKAAVITGFASVVFTSLYFAGVETGLAVIAEAAVASIISLALPKSWIASLKISFPGNRESHVRKAHEDRLRELISKRLYKLAEGYREVCESVITASDKLFKTNLNNIATVFDMAQRRTCRGCELVNVCWQRNYNKTMDSLNRVSYELASKKTLHRTDFPPEFQISCIRLNKFTDSVNESYRDWLLRRKLMQKQKQTRRLACEQYISLAKVMENTAASVKEKLTFDLHSEERIIKYLQNCGVTPKSVIVMTDEEGRTSVEIDLPRDDVFYISRNELQEKVNDICKAGLTQMSVKRRESIVRVEIAQGERIMYDVANFSAARAGEIQSGDSVSVFKTDKGRLVMQICDGMGSGRRAAIDSLIAVGVVKRIISSGFDNDTAVAVLNSAMLLKSDEESVTSVDVAVLDLFSGRCELLKMGAAPTYVLQDGQVTRIDANSLPLGILDDTKCQKSAFTLREGGTLVMVSDGVIANGDDFLCSLLEQTPACAASELCSRIVKDATAAGEGAREDDMSVVVCRI